MQNISRRGISLVGAQKPLGLTPSAIAVSFGNRSPFIPDTSLGINIFIADMYLRRVGEG